MKVSVALTTYNASRFIVEQLDSIRMQSRFPDEVVICDDVSSDDTVAIVRVYIKKYNLKNWTLHTNNKNLGWKQNFRKAIGICTGDIIFFSDQDDVWFLDKMERMTVLMEKYNMGCLYGESIKIDGDGNEIKALNEGEEFDENVEQIPFTPSFYMVGGLGCCMCVNRRVVDKYLSLNLKNDDHDSQCPRIAVYYDSLWHLNAPVIKYRIHQNNTSNISGEFTFGSGEINKRISNTEMILEWMKKVSLDNEVDETHSRYIKQAMVLQVKRIHYLKDKKTLFISLLPYCKRYTGLTMLMGDYAYKHSINERMGKLMWKIKKYYNHRKLI